MQQGEAGDFAEELAAGPGEGAGDTEEPAGYSGEPAGYSGEPAGYPEEPAGGPWEPEGGPEELADCPDEPADYPERLAGDTADGGYPAADAEAFPDDAAARQAEFPDDAAAVTDAAAPDSGPGAVGLEGPWPAGHRPSTGEPRVDAALARLDDLAGRPVTEHRAVFEDVHRRLRDVLGELDSRQPPAGPATDTAGGPER
jgi:hypothetical protein